MAAPPEELQPGHRVLHYQLVEKLGQGGMGVVWKATDSSLARAVALKALPTAFLADPERLARFEREARLLASLNHPSIATVYSVHLVDGVRYLSMEYVPGEDLAHRIARGPVPVPEALEIARQIAGALEAAHESGVVHRDLKPANILLTPDGRVKVLDFGLAKAMDSDARSSSLSASPTHAISAMTGNMIIGTAAYMSPEQARGQAADRRADIWSFGVVLHEMLTGTRAFDGETVSDTLAAVLRAEPDRAKLPAGLPPAVRTLLDRCLEKSPRRRLRDIGEAVLVLEDVIAGKGDVAPAATSAAPVEPGLRAWWPLAVAALAVIVAAVAWLRPAARPGPVRKLTLSLQGGNDVIQGLSLSPDGGRLAYLQGRELWLRDFSRLESRRLSADADVDLTPAWSPDGGSFAFVHGTTLSRVDVTSGAVTPICTMSGFTGGSGAVWRGDGRIVFTMGQDHIYEVSQSGGNPKPIIERIDSTEVDLHYPTRIPGKEAYACVLHTTGSGPSVLAVVEPGGKRHRLVEIQRGIILETVHDPRGYLLYARTGEGGGVWALPFSAERLRATGEPFLVAPDATSPTLAADGTLGFRLGNPVELAQLVEIDRQGVVRDTLIPSARGLWSLRLSPDGRALAVEVREGIEGDISLYDLQRRTLGRLAFGPGRQMEPAWSADGRSILFRDLTTSTLQLVPADGSRPPRSVGRGVNAQFMPDGRSIVSSARVGDSIDLVLTPIAGGTDTLRLPGPGTQEFPAPAPQAPFLAYESDESGIHEIYLRPWPEGEGRWQVSTNGGSRPQWSPRGDRLYYVHDAKFHEVEVQLTPSVRLGTPRVLFDLARLKIRDFARHTVIPTHEPGRFYAILDLEAERAADHDAVIVQNWLAEFARRK